MAAKLLYNVFCFQYSNTFPNAAHAFYCHDRGYYVHIVHSQQQETLCSLNMQNLAFCSTAWQVGTFLS